MSTRLFAGLKPLLRAVFATVLLTFGAAPRAVAQADVGHGTIEGIARSAEDGTPIAFAIVRLYATEREMPPAQGTLTDAEGRFRFAAVPAGDYRLQVERIGVRRALSPVVRVEPGETVSQDIRSATEPVRMAAVTVRPGPTCLPAERLEEDPRLVTLWNEARRGVEARRAFELRYRFVRTVRQDGEITWRFRGTRPLRKVDTLVHDPDSVIVRDQRHRARRRAEGYGQKGLLVVPNEKELLDDEFLRSHCFEAAVETSDGALGLRFRPIQPRRDGIGIRGTIWVDAATYLMRRLDFEWIRGNRPVGESRIDYADIAVAGSTLRLPSEGRASARASGLPRVVLTRAAVKFTYGYYDFQEIGDASVPEHH